MHGRERRDDVSPSSSLSSLVGLPLSACTAISLHCTDGDDDYDYNDHAGAAAADDDDESFPYLDLNRWSVPYYAHPFV